MARKQRHGQAVTSATFTTSLTSAAVALDLAAPTDGALIDEVHFTQKTAGVGTGTYTLQVRDTTPATPVAVSAISAALDLDAAADVVLGTVAGNATGMGAKGNRLEVNEVVTGTHTTAAVVIVTIFWLT